MSTSSEPPIPPSPATLDPHLDADGNRARMVLEQVQTRSVSVEVARSHAASVGDVVTPATVLAHRAAAIACRIAGEPGPALEHASRARAAAERIEHPIHQAEARYTQALCMAVAGRGQDASRTSDEAVSAATGHHLLFARTRVHRALVLQRLGEIGWEKDYAEALPTLSSYHDLYWESLAHLNRANALTYLGRLAEARSDLKTLLELPESASTAVLRVLGRHNLGFVEARSGNLAKALDQFLRGRSGILDTGGIAAAVVAQDTADALLAAGLTSEAVELVRAHLPTARNANPLVAAELNLLLAQALFAQDPEGASQAAAESAVNFQDQGRPGWTQQARSVETLAALKLERVSPEAAIAVAADVEAGGWPGPADEVRSAAATHAADEGDVALARRALSDLTSSDSHSLSVTLGVIQAAMAIARAEGDLTTALECAWDAAGALEEHRILLGASELRASVGQLARDVFERATIAALELGDWDQAINWVDRVRSQALDHPPVVPPGDTELAAGLGRLRMLVDAIAQGRATGSSVDRMEVDRHELEDRIRQHARTAAGVGTREVDRSERHAGTTEMAWLELGGRLTALVADDDGVRRVDLDVDASTVTTELDALAFAMQRVGRSRAPGRRRELAAQSLDHSLATLDEALIAPLELAGDGPVVVSPTTVLYDVPWSGLPSLMDRPVAIGPSLRLSRRPAREDVGDGCALVEGPRLDHARQELAALAEVVADARLLLGDEATVAATKDALSTAAIAHLACHGVFRSDNPQFSSLELANGPMFVYDLESLDRVPPLLVLSACQTGRSAVHAGDELLGVTASLLALGARHVVAALSDVPDDFAAVLMVAFHEAIAAGSSPAAALARARRYLLDRHPLPAARLTAAAFACIGAP